MDDEFGDFKVDYNVPEVINYDIRLLEKFIKKDPEPVLIFYGGEPTLCIDKMEEIMNRIKVKQFNIQTNGFQSRVYNDAQNVLQSQLSSNLNFSKRWTDKPISLSVGLTHSQNTQSQEMTINFPNAKFLRSENW